MKYLLLSGALALAACQTNGNGTASSVTTGSPKCDKALTELNDQDAVAGRLVKQKTATSRAQLQQISAYFKASTRALPSICPAYIAKPAIAEILIRADQVDRIVAGVS